MKLCRIDLIALNGNDGDHYRILDMQNKSKHFNHTTDRMMACPCCGVGTLSVSALMILETVRVHFDAPVTINAGARCKPYQMLLNPTAPDSRHIITVLDPTSDGADFTVKGVKPSVVRTFLKTLPYADLMGIGAYSWGTHADARGVKARW